MRRRLAALLLGLLAGGCPFNVQERSPCGHTEGRLGITWTLRGGAPTAAACQGIEHLELSVEGGECPRDGEVISPIPCALDRFEADLIPEGRWTLRLTAYSTAGVVVAEGSASADITTEAPADLTAIDLE